MERGKVERIELFHIEVPLPTPFFPAWIPGFHQNRYRYTLLRVTTRDGLVGHATGVAFDKERDGIGELTGQFLLGTDPYDLQAVSDRLHQASILGWRNSWMEVAFWDLAAQARGLPLYRLLAEHSGRPLATGGPPSRVEAHASFGEARAPKVRAEALERAQRLGFRAAKLSLINADVDADRRLMSEARSVVGPHFGLIAHAHQSSCIELVQALPRWDLARAKKTAEIAATLDYSWLQDPLRTADWEDLGTLAKASPIPIAGGDTCTSASDLRSLVSDRAVSVLTPDAVLCGLGAVSRGLGRCLDAGVGFSPTVYGDGLAVAANLHALAAWQWLEGASGPKLLDFPWEPPALIPELRDALLSEPLHIDSDGGLDVPQSPGLGVSVDERALRRFGQRFYTVTPVRFLVSSARREGLKQTAAFAEAARSERKKSRSDSEPPKTVIHS